MDVNEGTIGAAMNCVASMAIEELAQTKRVSASEAAAEFLASKTAEMLFDDSTKLWWEGPSAIVDEYLRESMRWSDNGDNGDGGCCQQ